MWHLIGGSAGCAYAREHGAHAVIVDALRASATAASLLHHGASEILAVATLEDAFRARDEAWPDAVLFGERQGVAPDGFDQGNRPCMAKHAEGKRVVFTTTNGTARMMEAEGAAAIHLASAVNALAAVEMLADATKDVVLIPAGLVADEGADAPEDWAAATFIGMLANAHIGEGALVFRDYRQLIELDGLLNLFESAPHADALRSVGLAHDIADCARTNVYTSVPTVHERNRFGLVVRDARRA